jgi:hypothetical protein
MAVGRSKLCRCRRTPGNPGPVLYRNSYGELVGGDLTILKNMSSSFVNGKDMER